MMKIIKKIIICLILMVVLNGCNKSEECKDRCTVTKIKDREYISMINE